MRFKQQKSSSPEVNLVPMLDVLMTVLTFFIIISMTLALEQGVQVNLPAEQADTSATTPPPLLRVNLNQTGILLNDRSVASAQLEPQIQAFLQQNTTGIVVLQAEPEVPYEQVVQLLDRLKAMGGNRVSLAID